MGMDEGAATIVDIVEAQLVECCPPADEDVLSVNVSAQPDVVPPVSHAQDATIEQTGAEPPP